MSRHTAEHVSVHHNTRVVLATTVAAIITSFLVLLGWALDIELLKRIFPTLVAMNPMTAVAFLLAAIALWLSHVDWAGRRTLLIVRLLTGLVVLIGLLKLSETLFGSATGPDQLLFPQKLTGDLTGKPNRMAPNTALNFCLLGCALLLLKRQSWRGFFVSEAFVLLLLFNSLLPILGYAYEVKQFYGIGAFIPMAPHTALVFLALGVGVLFTHPSHHLTRTLLDPGVSGMMVRQLLPTIIGLPIIIGWLRLEGQRLGLYETEFGVALSALVYIVFLTGLVWLNSVQLFRIDTQRKHAEAQIRELSLTDDLTGLRNRRGFFLLGEQALKLAQAKRVKLDLWLIYADLDGLKSINDCLGHEVGSQAIVHAAETIKATFREIDITARLGGDEFVILAASNEANAGSVMLARLENNLHDCTIREQLPYHFSMSFGAVQVNLDLAVSLEDVLGQADEAMYEQKRGKKNRQERA